MKTCPRCKQELSLDTFSPSASRKDGKQPYCRECMKAYRLEHYRSNPGPYKERARKRQDELREYVRVQKDNPCTDCGQSYPYYVMQFDHIGDDKIAEVGVFAARGNWAGLLAELDKCELVCANCHMIRTHERWEAKKALDTVC